MQSKETFIEKLYEMSSDTVLIPPDRAKLISCGKFFEDIFNKHGISDTGSLTDDITENAYMFRKGFIFGAGLVMDTVYADPDETE